LQSVIEPDKSLIVDGEARCRRPPGRSGIGHPEHLVERIGFAIVATQA
jgi:hypothetical protein